MDMGQEDARLGLAGAAVPAFPNNTVKDAAQMRAELEAFKLHVEQKHHALFKRVLAEALTGLVLANPVGNPALWQTPRKGYVGGHSRRNWQITAVPAAPEIPGVDPSGDQTQAASYQAIAQIPLQQKRAYLVNPVDYMAALDRGHSSQAPAGWINNILQQVLQKYAVAQ